MPILEGEGSALTLVEVGGYPPRIRDFLPGREIMVVDREEGNGPDYTRAEGTDLPFADNRFNVAVSLDTLEHIHVSKRALFVSELCRVADSYVIVAAPFASDAVKAADRAIFEFIREHAGYEHPYLKEHVELALPDLVTTLVQMVDHGLDVQVIPSGRLDRWMLMMGIYYTLDADPELRDAVPFIMEAYNRAFYDFDKAEPAYRHFLIGAYEGLGRRWGQLADLASGEATDAADFRALSLVLELARTLALKAKDKECQGLRAKIAAREQEIESLRQHITALQDFTEKVKSLPLYPLYERFLKPRGKS